MEEGTRVAILLAAERLFADRGFGVSLREIGTAAGQRNHSAVQYHFGTRQRLAEALFAYRMEPINVRRLDLIARLRSTGREKDLDALTDALVRPLAEHVLAHRGNSSYVRFMARLLLSEFQPEPLGHRYTEGVSVILDLMNALRPDLTDDRYNTVYLHMATVLANLERSCDDPDFDDARAEHVIADLYLTTTAILAAPRPED